MTISSTTRKAGPFPGNNVATVFPFVFKVFKTSDLKVLLVDQSGVSTTLTLDSDYSVVFAVNQDSNPGGSILYPKTGAPLPTGYSLVALGALPNDQETDLTNTGGFYPQTIEDMVDRSTIQIQQLAEQMSRAILVTEAENSSPPLPPASVRAGGVLGFDSQGNIEVLPVTPAIGAGDLRNESWTDGVDFTAGTSTSVLLSRNYGTKANLGTVVMAGIAQDPASYSLNGNRLQFDAVIPLGVTRAWCVGGTTLSQYAPANGTVGTDTLVDGAVTTVKILDAAVTAAKLAPGTGGFYTDVGTPPQVWKLADRVRIGNSQAMNADLIWNAGPAFTTPFGWQERDSTLFVASDGRLGISGLSQTSKNVGPFPGVGFSPTAIGVNGLTFNDDIAHGSLAWAGYFEAYRVQGAGAIYGLEIDVGDGNLGGTVNDPYNVGGSAAVGILLNSGGSTGLGYQQPASAAMIIGNNGGTFRRGLVFNHDSLTAFPGQDPAAIAMAQGHAIEWFNAVGNTSTTIRSDVSAAGGNKHLTFEDTTVYIGNNGLNEAFVFSLPVTAANGFQFSATAPGVGLVAFSAQGPDANIDIEIDPKGGGVLKYGLPFNAGAPTPTGYAFIKLNDGVLRKMVLG